jgi:hypothetical protein
MRIWRCHGLKPRRLGSFKLPNDPQFEENLEAVAGLYLSLPEHPLVLCSDLESLIRTFDRTQPGLPMKRGQGASMAHDYKRHGTRTLFAELNARDGSVITDRKPRHVHEELLAFPPKLDREAPKGRVLHLICDNYGTHEHPRVKPWLKKHPRFHMRFTPTPGPWLNMVERFFRSITVARLHRRAFQSVAGFTQVTEAYIDAYNETPKCFFRTAMANDILQKVMCGRATFRMVQTA